MAPPPPPLDEALPSRRPQRPAAATSAPTPTPNANASRCHFLLAKRVMTVAEFRQERLVRSRINHPHLQPRGIPVPLYPGETQHQYNYKFRQWLTGRRGSLEAMRDDPKRERKMWLTFAFMREKPKEATERTGAQRVLKRSIDEEYEAFYQRSASQAIKRSRRDRSMDSDRSDSSRGRSPTPRVQERREHRRTSPSRGDYFVDEEITAATHSRPIDRRSEILNSYQMPPRAPRHRSSSPASQSSRDQPLYPRSRTEILASHVLSADDYLREMKGPKQSHRSNGKLAKIPVPLFPGETMDDYEQDFGRWLHHRQTSMLSLRLKPLKERVYRHQFAQQRVTKWTTSPSSKRPRSQTRSRSPVPKAKNDFHEAHKASDSLVRDEVKHNLGKYYTSLPAHSHGSSSPPRESMENEADTEFISHHISCSLSMTSTTKIEQKRSADCESKYSDTSAPSTTPSPQKDKLAVEKPSPAKEPVTEKQEATNAPHAISSEADIAAEDSSTQLRRIAHLELDTLKTELPTRDKLPSWAWQLICHVQELETKVTRLQRHFDSCACCQKRSSCGYESATDPAREFNIQGQSPLREPTQKNPTSLSNGVATHGTSHSKFTDIQAKSETLNENGAEMLYDAQAPLSTTKDRDERAHGRKEKVREKLQTCEDIHRDATRNLARAVQSRVKEDLKKQQLVEAYDRLNEQISMNETAIDDALDYIKAIKDVDEGVALEQHNQIMELVVSINKEKERRAGALAALIVYSFADKQDALISLLEGEPSRERRNGANHDKLRTISSQIEEKDSVLETLETHLNEQLQWVTGIPSCVPVADKALRFKALRKMSKRLTKEQAAKEQLERERDQVMKSFLRDEEIRKLVNQVLGKK